MAFTREFIRKLAKECDVELPKEFIDGIISEHSAVKEQYANEILEAKKDEGKGDIKESEEYKQIKKLYDDEKQAFENYKNQVAEQETKSKKIEAFKNLLQKSGVSQKRIDSVVKVSGDTIDKIEFGDDNSVKNGNDISEIIKSEWADFIMKPEQVPAEVATPPVLDGGKTTAPKESRAAKIAAEYHKNLYGENPTPTEN